MSHPRTTIQQTYLKGVMPEEIAQANFKKSQLSASGNCVEVAQLANNLVAVRDSKGPKDAVLVFDRQSGKPLLEGSSKKSLTSSLLTLTESLLGRRNSALALEEQDKISPLWHQN